MGHATVEWVYVGAVISLLTWVGADSWNVEHSLEHAPANAQTVKVIGQQWFWTFEHQDGKQEVGELHLTAGVPYRFEIVSKDVIHSFNIPDYTVLMDAVPGRVNTIWNNFDKPGEYLIQCREYCGLLHYNMRAKLFVAPATEATSTTGGGAAATTATTGANAPVTTNETQTSGGGGGGGNLTNATGGGGAATTTAGGGVSLNILQGAATQGNPAYSPNPLTVKKGDSISVVNKDAVPHTVTNGKDPSDPNSAKLFDTSIINAGQSAQITTTKLSAGQQYPFHCTVHPYMTGTLKVS
jgi:cytochrome c oxidase subunit 2